MGTTGRSGGATTSKGRLTGFISGGISFTGPAGDTLAAGATNLVDLATGGSMHSVLVRSPGPRREPAAAGGAQFAVNALSAIASGSVARMRECPTMA